jgi:hypothetical protein
MELSSLMDARIIGDAGYAVNRGVRRVVDDRDDEDGVRKGGRRFKQAGTPNLHLLHSFPCLADTQRWRAGIPSFLALLRLIRLEERWIGSRQPDRSDMQVWNGRTIMRPGANLASLAGSGSSLQGSNSERQPARPPARLHLTRRLQEEQARLQIHALVSTCCCYTFEAEPDHATGLSKLDWLYY